MVKRPRIETNEGPPHKSVQITANVVVRPDSTFPVVIKPYKLDISQFSTSKVRDKMSFEITNKSEHDLDLKLVYRPEGLFDLTLPDKIPAGKTVEGTLQLHPDAIDSSFEKSFTFELNDPTHSRFTVPVKRTKRTPGEPENQAATH